MDGGRTPFPDRRPALPKPIYILRLGRQGLFGPTGKNAGPSPGSIFLPLRENFVIKRTLCVKRGLPNEYPGQGCFFYGEKNPVGLKLKFFVDAATGEKVIFQYTRRTKCWVERVC
jgi:hypothetical protein